MLSPRKIGGHQQIPQQVTEHGGKNVALGEGDTLRKDEWSWGPQPCGLRLRGGIQRGVQILCGGGRALPLN